jgi:hypothetical protein
LRFELASDPSSLRDPADQPISMGVRRTFCRRN